jgi:hypothetical protein
MGFSYRKQGWAFALSIGLVVLASCTSVTINNPASASASGSVSASGSANTTAAPVSTPTPTAARTPAPIATPTTAPTATPTAATPVTLASGTWAIKMVTSRGSAFYPNLAVNFAQTGGLLRGSAKYTYSSGGTTLQTWVSDPTPTSKLPDSTVDGSGNVILIFNVYEGTSLRAKFTFTGKAGSAPPQIRDRISGDPDPSASGLTGFQPCTPGCGYVAELESGAREIGFFTMRSN